MTFTVPSPSALATHWPQLVFAAAVVAITVAVLLVSIRAVRAARHDRGAHTKSHATTAYYVVSAIAMGLSMDTSFRFFGDQLHIVGLERVGLFSVIDLALIACGLGMRANVSRIDPVTGRAGSPGAPRMLAWVLCGFAGYAALIEAGPVEGLARVAFGPILAMVMLHFALGLEIVHRGGHRSGAWVRLTGELRERALSMLGVGDEARDSVTQAQRRAGRRLVRLALAPEGRQTARWARRVEDAVRKSSVGTDTTMQLTVLREIAAARTAVGLPQLDLWSPWQDQVDKVNRQRNRTNPDLTHTSPSPPPPASAVPSADVVPSVEPAPADNIITATLPAERPDWLTDDLTAGQAMQIALDRHGEHPGAVLDRWAASHRLDFKPGLGRTVLARWRASRRVTDTIESASGE